MNVSCKLKLIIPLMIGLIFSPAVFGKKNTQLIQKSENLEVFPEEQKRIQRFQKNIKLILSVCSTSDIQTHLENRMIRPDQILVRSGNLSGTGENHRIASIIEENKEGIINIFSYPIEGYSLQNMSGVPNIEYTVIPLQLNTLGVSKFKIAMKTNDNHFDPKNAENILKQYGFQKPEQVFFVTVEWQTPENIYHFFDSNEKTSNEPQKVFSMIEGMFRRKGSDPKSSLPYFP